MNPFALTLAALLLSSLPALAQESEADRLKKEVEKLKADNAALRAELEAKSKFDQITKERLLQDLATPEEKQAEMARKKKIIEEKEYKREQDMKAAALAQLEAARQKADEDAKRPSPPRPVTRFYGTTSPAVMGKVTAVANEIGLVVVSVGSDQGVLQGDEFTVTREKDVLAKIRIDRVDRKWAAGKVVEQRGPPFVGDDVARSNPKAVPAPGAPLQRAAADEVQSLRKELDEVRNQVRQLTDRLVPSFQGAGVSVEETPTVLSDHLGIPRGLVVRRIREGSPAEKAGLKPHDVVPDLLEAQLVEALESGMPIHIIRQGAKVRLPGAKGR